MADELPFKQDRKCVSSMWQQKERSKLCLEIYQSNKHYSGNVENVDFGSVMNTVLVTAKYSSRIAMFFLYEII